MSDKKLKLSDFFRWDEDEHSWVCAKCGEPVGTGVSFHFDVVDKFDWVGDLDDSFTLECVESKSINQKLVCSCGVVIPEGLYEIQEAGVIIVGG